MKKAVSCIGALVLSLMPSVLGAEKIKPGKLPSVAPVHLKYIMPDSGYMIVGFATKGGPEDVRFYYPIKGIDIKSGYFVLSDPEAVCVDADKDNNFDLEKECREIDYSVPGVPNPSNELRVPARY